MTWFDLAMLAVLALSALLAFFRGFVREVLGVGAWIGAIFVGYWFFPFVAPKFEQWIHAKEFADPAAIAVVFVVALIVLSVISSWVGAFGARLGAWRGRSHVGAGVRAREGRGRAHFLLRRRRVGDDAAGLARADTGCAAAPLCV